MFKEVLSEPIVNENHIAERRTARRRRFDLRRIKPIRNSFNFHVNSRMGLHKGNDHIPLPCIFLIEIKMDQLEMHLARRGALFMATAEEQRQGKDEKGRKELHW